MSFRGNEGSLMSDSCDVSKSFSPLMKSYGVGKHILNTVQITVATFLLLDIRQDDAFTIGTNFR